MIVSKRHHYTPRYLCRFENADGGLWRLDHETGVVTTGNNERFGFKHRWNTLQNPPPGYAPDWAEKQIAVVDGFASKTVAEILDGRFPADISKLAVAVSFIHHNQPRLRRELEALHADKVGHWSEDHRLVVRLKTALDNWRTYLRSITPLTSFRRSATSGFSLRAIR